MFYFDFSETSDLVGLYDTLKISSFFNEHKLLICRNLFSNKATSEKILSFLKELGVMEDQDITVLVIESSSEKDLILKHRELFKLLSNKDNLVKTINSLTGNELYKWIKNEFQSRECQIQGEVIKKLVDIVGNNSWTLTNEINKLANYSGRGEVKTEYINLLTSRPLELNIFDLIDTVAQKNKPKAYGLLYQELKSGGDPYYILTMIIYQFRNLLMIKGLQEQGFSQGDIAKRTKLHPFVVKKAANNSKNFTIEELKSIYQHLSSLDIRFKNGLIDLNDRLCQLALNQVAC